MYSRVSSASRRWQRYHEIRPGRAPRSFSICSSSMAFHVPSAPSRTRARKIRRIGGSVLGTVHHRLRTNGPAHAGLPPIARDHGDGSIIPPGARPSHALKLVLTFRCAKVANGAGSLWRWQQNEDWESSEASDRNRPVTTTGD